MSVASHLSGKGIVLVNSLSGGGAEKVVATLYDQYRRMGRDIDLVCLEKNNVHALTAGHPEYLSESSTGREGFLAKLASLFVHAWRLKTLVAKRKVTFVQSHIYRANYVNILAKMLGSRHYAQITNHGMASHYHQEGLKGKVNLALVRWLYPSADELICPSSGMLSDLQRNGVRLPASRVIGNPFDCAMIRKLAALDFDPHEFRMEPNKQYVICVGRLERVKAFDQALEALARFSRKEKPVELVILGTGPQGDALVSLAEKLGLADRVHFLGHVKNPFKYIAHADVLLASSRYEGFSNVIVEALACGTCVVSTDCPSGPREILAPGAPTKSEGELGTPEFAKYGVLVSVGNVEQMADAVKSVTEYTELAGNYRKLGLIRASSFDASQVAKSYLTCV
jgi:N-acetylgalactosamine-N,N'-diacetylbacillosaminyl-diphospho-undecaprenol 4-alpha-N-acetylgalactosaminyltransferase